jgi:hypothetical protein
MMTQTPMTTQAPLKISTSKSMDGYSSVSCHNCNLRFQPDRRTQKFCSASCREAFRLVAPSPRPCESCKQTFQPRLSNQRCCSQICYRRNYRSEHPEYTKHHKEVSNAARLSKGVVTAAIRAELREWAGNPEVARAMLRLGHRLNLFDGRKQRFASRPLEKSSLDMKPITPISPRARCPGCYKFVDPIGLEHHRLLYRCMQCRLTFFAH